MSGTVTTDHPLLRSFTGIKTENFPVTQYLGVKYASISQRFEQSKLYEHATEDATKFGPACPQIPGALQIEQEYLIQKAVHLAVPAPTENELECLNLNITVPNDFGGQKRLPVLVWIHGGGFLFGANFWPHTDMARLVTLSQKTGKPFIGIALNYRTGVFGFLTSPELKEAGSEGNYGIRDQINAFSWIQKFIAGFGGDPDNVTAIGESCGGVSATLLLHNKEPLFRRVISMGGHALLMAPVSLEAAGGAYQHVVGALGLTDLSPAERVAKLRTITPDEIIAKVPRSVPNRPVIDHKLFSKPITAADVQDATAIDAIPGKAWCQELLIGDCQADGYIMSGGLQARKDGIAAQFILSLKKSMAHQPELVSQILEKYSISETDAGDDAFHRIVAVLTDIGFYAPTRIALKGWPRPTGSYLYHFNAANPFPGPLQGKASHILDVAFAFQVYNEFLSAADVDVAEKFGTAIIDFAQDGNPGWGAWSEAHPESYQVFGHTGDEQTIFGTEGKSQRRPFVLDFLKKYEYELLWNSLQNFLKGE